MKPKVSKDQKTASQLTNTASELYVASLLSRLGYNVSITFGSSKIIDLMVAHPDGRVVTIDVKGLKNKTNWPLSPKRKTKNHFFVLVSYLDRFSDVAIAPESFVIPSTQIGQVLSSWSGLPNVTAVGYKDVKNTKFREAWDLLF